MAALRARPQSLLPFSSIDPHVTEAIIACSVGRAEVPEGIQARAVAISQEPACFAARGVRLQAPPDVTRVELFEAMLVEHRQQLLLPAAELQGCMQRTLREDPQASGLVDAAKLVVEVDDWYHPRPGTAAAAAQ